MAAMRPQSRPLTAKVTMEVVYDDKSKEIIETVELDVTAVPRYGGGDADPHLRIGAETPWDREPTRSYAFDSLRVIPPASEFCLELRLPAVDGNKHIFKSTKIDPPDTSVVMIYNADKPVICNFDETVAAEKAAHFGTHGSWNPPIYFLLDIP